MKLWLLLSCLTVILYEFANAQCANRPPPCNMMNEALIETPRNIIPQPVAPSFAPQATLIDNPCNICNSFHQIPTTNVFPPTTIITDYSPAICKHLADTLQLMVVCNLLQGNKGSSELALQLASPVVKEVLSSPTFSRAVNNPIYSNSILPNTITTPILNSNFIPSPSMSPLLQPPTPCNKGILPNILSLLRNLN